MNDGWTRGPKHSGTWTRIRSDDAEWSPISGDGDCSQWDQINHIDDGLGFDGLLCWILSGGTWSDSCFWRDLSLWEDGPSPWAEVA